MGNQFGSRRVYKIFGTQWSCTTHCWLQSSHMYSNRQDLNLHPSNYGHSALTNSNLWAVVMNFCWKLWLRIKGLIPHLRYVHHPISHLRTQDETCFIQVIKLVTVSFYWAIPVCFNAVARTGNRTQVYLHAVLPLNYPYIWSPGDIKTLEMTNIRNGGFN